MLVCRGWISHKTVGQADDARFPTAGRRNYSGVAGCARLALAAAHEARLTPRELDELTLHRIKAEMALKRSRESKALQRCKDAIRALRTTIVDGLFSG